MCHTDHRMHFALSNGVAHGIFRFPESSEGKAGFPDNERILPGLSGGGGRPDSRTTNSANKKAAGKSDGLLLIGQKPVELVCE